MEPSNCLKTEYHIEQSVPGGWVDAVIVNSTSSVYSARRYIGAGALKYSL